MNIEELKKNGNYKFECNISDNILEEIKDVNVHDEWGCAFVFYGEHVGVEYNFCIDHGTNSSGIYKTVVGEDNILSTDYSTSTHYEIDFENDNWKKELENAMCSALLEFFEIDKIKLPEKEKASYVSMNLYTSTDWHDMASVVTQLQQDGVYEIEDVDTFVSTNIYEHIKDMVDKDITTDTIKEIMNGNDDAYIDTIAESYEKDGVTHVVPDRIEVFAKAHSGIGYQSHFDAFDYTHLVTYGVSEIEKQNVAYLVSEHIVNPGKGCDLLERLYHEPFTSLEEAQAYMDELNKDYDHSGSAYRESSGYKLSIVDKEAILENPWYKNNMLALDYMQRLKLDPKEYRFWYSHGVVSELQEKIYEQSADAEKLSIDKDVYGRIREYLSDVHQQEIDTQLNVCESNSREIVDRALVLAHVDATSQEDYEGIRKSLGEYESRINQLTYANVKETRGHGHVCITKNGEIGYFRNSYGINDWEGAKDNPYFGKFSHNMGAGVDQFENYRFHDMFVDELPDQAMIDDYYQQYSEWETNLMKDRAKSSVKYKTTKPDSKGHVYVVSSLEDFEINVGSRLLYGDERKSEKVRFNKTYGSHIFNDDEIRTLLAGYELTINDCKLATGQTKEISIRLSRMESDKGIPYIGFERIGDSVEKNEKVSLSEKIKDASGRPGQKGKSNQNTYKDLEL